MYNSSEGFKLYDYIAIFVFTHVFYYGIIGMLVGSYIGLFIILIGWEFWKIYERWRISK